jgi:hypothetical protein
MSATSDDQLLDGLATQPDAQPNPNRAALVTASDPSSIDSGALLYTLARRLRQLRDLLATARQAIQDIRARDTQQDARLTALETDVAALKAKVGL